LNYLRASLAIERGDRAEARRLAKLVTDQETTFEPAYLVLIGLALQDNRHEETLEWLKKSHERVGTAFQDLTTVPEYARFVKSPQFKEWLKYLEEDAKAKKAKNHERPEKGTKAEG
jgi:hypothetical protein